jgi:bifunctional non-homologous end joining protein LigD
VQLEAEHPVTITHPDKPLWPEAGVSKLDYMHYLVTVAPVLIPHLQDRPLTMIRYPHGIHGHSFYQKDAPTGTPEWVRTVPLWSEDRKDMIHAVVVDSVASLLWLANLGCLEMHVGFATIHQPDHPTSVAFDLDPSVPGFEPVREVALAIHELLDQLELPHVAKTSGATGLQIFIPIAPEYSWTETKLFTKAVADYVAKKNPHSVTLERLTKNRGAKVYIDYPQHGNRRTLIAAYSARANIHAKVSTPIRWDELSSGAIPEDFTIHSVPNRIVKHGDLMSCGAPAKLNEIVSFLQKHNHASL